jgi:hypothetical protein
MDQLLVLDTSDEIIKLAMNLPDYLISKWDEIVYDHQLKHVRYPPIEMFSNFVGHHTDIACNPSSTELQVNLADQSAKSKPRGQNTQDKLAQTTCKYARSFVLNTELNSDNHTSNCMLCSIPGHDATVCRTLGKLKQGDEEKFLHDNRL